MLGWHVTTYRLSNLGALVSATDVSELRANLPTDESLGSLLNVLVQGEQVAVWQADIGGLEWIFELIKDGRALQLSWNGYPNVFVALARDLIPQILAGPPQARDIWVAGPDDVLLPQWKGKTVIDPDAATNCGPTEWLLVEAWDES